MIRRAIIIFLVCIWNKKCVFSHLVMNFLLDDIGGNSPKNVSFLSLFILYYLLHNFLFTLFSHNFRRITDTHTHKLTPKCSKMKNKQILQWMQIFLSTCRVVSYKKAKVWKWNENESTFHVNTVRQFQLFLFTW